MVARSQPVAIAPKPKAEPLDNWRCPHCHRLLLRIFCGHGSKVVIEVSCPKCGSLVVLERAA